MNRRAFISPLAQIHKQNDCLKDAPYMKGLRGKLEAIDV